MFGSNKPALISKRPVGFPGGKDLSDKLGPYFFEEDHVCNFAISGQGDKERLVRYVLAAAAGRIPVVILHNNSYSMTAEVARVWTEKFGSVTYDEEGPLWSCSAGGFEPFLGLREMDIVQIMKNLAGTAGYACTANYEKVVKAHLNILRHMGCEYSLSGLHYLCGFEDLEQFQSNILALGCSQSEKNQILSNLGLSNEKEKEQFDQFRSMIGQMAYEAQRSGWNPDGQVGTMNLTTAIQNGAMMMLSVSSQSSFLMAYLGQELRLHSNGNFLLLVDDVCLENSGIISVLREAGRDLRFGLMGSSILDMIGQDKIAAQKFCEKLDRIILLKHKVATTAQALTELLGTIEINKESKTVGTGKGFFDWLPDSQHKSTTFTKEDRNRIRPEQLLGLGNHQAILFNGATNEIHYF